MKQNQQSRHINHIAREKLAHILLFDIADPNLSLVVVSDVEVSVDKSLMVVYVSCESSRYEEVQRGFARAKSRIRRLLGHALDWRVTPALVFKIDTTADQAERISQALQDVPTTLHVSKDEFGYPIEE